MRSARETHGLDVRNGVLESAELPGRHGDVIIMSHVFEHVPDPLQTLITAHRLLKPGGRLHVLTPNASDLGINESPRVLQIIRHDPVLGSASHRKDVNVVFDNGKYW